MRSDFPIRHLERLMDEAERHDAREAYSVLRRQRPWKHERSHILHHRVLPFATLAPWLNDSQFQTVYRTAKDNTLVDEYRCHELWLLAKQSTRVNGSILEVGVWKGGTGAILAAATASSGKTVFLADTFKGVVKAGENDTAYQGGEHADTSPEIVARLLASLSLQNAKILKGVFPEETQQLVTGPISMLHCDVDVYDSAKGVVEWCLPRMPIGAVLVFDDYGFFGCEGVTTYCQEMTSRDDLLFIHNLNGHAVFVKIAE